MGKASRWLKSLLGMKKDKENVDNFSNYSEKKDKKRWSFGRPSKDLSNVGSQMIPPAANIPMPDSSWLRSYMEESEKDRNRHAIAVAAATATAANAAVAAAQAAVAVVRLTSHGRGGPVFNLGRDKWAAVKIQSFFRGYLARKALRALKGLVKIQALVRGYLVRKRAAATLHSMQALIRAQAAVRSQRARRSMNGESRFPAETRARKSIERFDECRSAFHSKRLSMSYDNGPDESPKIVEIDTYKLKPKALNNNNNACLSECGDDQNYYYHHAVSSPLPCPAPGRLSIPDGRHFHDFDWSFLGDDGKFPTAQNTPRFGGGGSGRTTNPNAPPTPAKSVCGDSFFRPYSNFPSYMANTQSFRAKLRSHSAPKQRPEAAAAGGPKKRLSLNEMMASRSSFTGVRMQNPNPPCCSQVQEEYGF